MVLTKYSTPPWQSKKTSPSTAAAPTSRAIKVHQPCDHCGSSDALAIYDDGHTFRFSCNHLTQGDSPIETPEQTNDDFEYTYQYVSMRGLTAATMEKYGILTKVNPEGEPVAQGYTYLS